MSDLTDHLQNVPHVTAQQQGDVVNVQMGPHVTDRQLGRVMRAVKAAGYEIDGGSEGDGDVVLHVRRR